MAKSLELYGKIVRIDSPVAVTEKLTKREFWIYQAESYEGNVFENWVKFTLLNKNCPMIDSWGVEDFVKVTFKVTGRPFTPKEIEGDDSIDSKKLFNENTAWKIESGKKARNDERAAQQQQQQQQGGQPQQQRPMQPNTGGPVNYRTGPTTAAATPVSFGGFVPDPNANDDLPF